MSSNRIKNEKGGAAKVREKKRQEALTNSMAGSMLRYVKKSKPSPPDESVEEENNKSSKEATRFDHDQAENSGEHSNEHEFDENENEEDKEFGVKEYQIDGDINDPGSWGKVDKRMRDFLVEKMSNDKTFN